MNNLDFTNRIAKMATHSCDCESDECAKSNTHIFAGCANVAQRIVMVFGMMQWLCEDCITFAKNRYPGHVNENPYRRSTDVF